MSKPQEESLCLRRSLWKQKGEFQKDETKVKLPCHWVSEPCSIREVTFRNEQHHENVEGAGHIDSSASVDSVHLSSNQNICRI
jgi:hypothetical protein